MHSATWRNWSGSVRSSPADIATPESEPELAATIARARKVRVVGAGHSFTPLCDTGGTLVSLSELRDSLGEVAADNTVWAPAGCSLKMLTQALWDKGYSLPNQGDINLQSLAGAISTGTHGTGKDLSCLSAIAHGFRLMLADGSILECDRATRPDVFEAQRLCLGLLGVLLRIRIAVLPAYRLEERIEKMHLGEVIERFDDLATTHRHAEFFIFPYSDHAIVKTLHPTEDTGSFREESTSSHKAFWFCCKTTSIFPKVAPTAEGDDERRAQLASRRPCASDLSIATHRAIRGDRIRVAPPSGISCPPRGDRVDPKVEASDRVSIRVSLGRSRRHVA
jgi:hypothetical protein